MDKVIRLFLLCILVGAFLMFWATLSWWVTVWYENLVLFLALLGLGCIIFKNDEKSQEFFAAGLGTVAGSFLSYIWLTPMLIKFVR